MNSLVRVGCALLVVVALAACTNKTEKRPVVLHFSDGTNMSCESANFDSAIEVVTCKTSDGGQLRVTWNDHLAGYEVVNNK